MGSPANEAGRFGDEGPQRAVAIGRAFGVGKYEVTFSEWDACVAGGGCNGYRPNDQGWGRGRQPVINVSWDDAKAYVAWLSRRTGQAYRLLSESEWEYVARAGTTTPFHFGATITAQQANYDATRAYGNGPTGIYRQRTVAVGEFPANAFGIHDMHGNVWEWVEDCGHGDYTGGPTDGTAWVTTCTAASRVLRGGSWDLSPGFVRSAYRGRYSSGLRNVVIGFRVARTL